MKGGLFGLALVIIAVGLRWSKDLPMPPGADSYAYLPMWLSGDVALLFTIVLAFSSVWLVHRLRQHIKLPDLVWVFSISPYFVYTTLFTTPAVIAQPLFLAAVLGYLANVTLVLYASLFVLSWLGFTHAVVAFIFLSLVKKKPWVALPGLIYMASQARFTGASGLLTELGSKAGLSSFAVLLAIMGMVLLWKYKSRYYWLFVSAFGLLALSAYEQSLMVYANIIVVLLVATAIGGIRKAKWKLVDVQKLFLLLLFCGLLFSGLSYAIVVGDMAPNKDVEEALYPLRDSNSHALVFSHPDNGHWIEWFGERQALLYPGEHNEEASQRMLSYDLDETIFYFSRNGVTHILITKDMIGKVWDREDQGMLFLLKNQLVFEPVVENEYATLYEFKGKR
ncbi:MAG: hypothetical protein QF486_06030 [Candidatus Woesearchaeota archaeon]|nr:hypothetical protein [Candidatus Woesearchaeota archaeon]MDP7199144.1 hypothetical protein [Candidatus Woesearchaeota archaeon]MDP7467593.1 hypothetical protein [Candidatus Woesearchaeota archaeon]MDP7647075.1 hypothetical protein [Candidatus Woesearchaeota archaeon]